MVRPKRFVLKNYMFLKGWVKPKFLKYVVEIFVLLLGIEGFEIGDTIADLENPEALPRIQVDQPTMSMLFTINNSPFLR